MNTVLNIIFFLVWKAYACLNIWLNLTFNAPFWSLINGSKITNLCECLAKSAVISKLLRTRFRPIYRVFLYIVGLYIVMTLSIPMFLIIMAFLNELSEARSYNKMGCIFPMVAVSIMPHLKFGRIDHREGTIRFTGQRYAIEGFINPFGIVPKHRFVHLQLCF